MTEPTDAEAWEMWLSQPLTGHAPKSVGNFARAVLAKWGTPSAIAGEPWGACVSGRVFVGGLPDHVRKLAEAENLPIQWLYTTPQPTQAQAGAVPLTNARLQDISLDYSDSEDECTGFRDGWRAAEKHYGIKGGQHAE